MCTCTDLYPRDDLYLHTSEKMIGGAYLFSLVRSIWTNDAIAMASGFGRWDYGVGILASWRRDSTDVVPGFSAASYWDILGMS